MLKLIGEWKSSLLFKIILFSVATSFVGFGGYTLFNAKDTSIAAKVNGMPISVAEFSTEYNNILEFYRNIFKGNIPENIKKNINKNAMDQLIDKRLKMAEVTREGIVISDDEVIETIQKNNKDLDKDGAFNWTEYMKIPKQRRYEYENGIAKHLSITKLETIVKDGIKISPQEVKDAYLKENQQVKVEYIALTPGYFKEKISTDEDKLKKFYESKKDTFRTKDKFKAAYAYASFRESEKDIKIDEPMINNYYKEHADEYFVEERVSASHILIKTPQGDAQAEARGKEKAEGILKEIKGGLDFHEAAKKYSEDTSAPSGGDIGYFSKGRMVKEFEEAAFMLKVNEVSGVIKTTFGYHIIKLTDKQDAHTKPIEEVRGAIEASLKKEEGDTLSKRRIKKLRKTLESEGEKSTIQDLARIDSIPFNETDYFSEGDAIPGIPDPALFVKEASSLKKGDVSDVITMGDTYYLLKLTDKKESYIPDMAEIKPIIENGFKEEEAKRLMEAKGDELFSGLTGGKPIGELASAIETQVVTTGLFKKGGEVDGTVGRDEEFIKTSLSLDTGKGGIVKSNNAVYLIKVLEKTGLDEQKFKEEEKTFTDKVLKNKQQMGYQEWSEALKKKADIWISDRFRFEDKKKRR